MVDGSIVFLHREALTVGEIFPLQLSNRSDTDFYFSFDAVERIEPIEAGIIFLF